MSHKPVVGIIACNRTVGVENAHAVMERYVRAAVTYGDCHALLIPPLEAGFSAGALTARLDGLILTGSPSNIQPQYYAQTTIKEDAEGPFDDGRDTVAMAMIESMITLGRPVFGICRGFQELNVVLGGTLRRDVGFGTQHGGIDHHAPDGTGFAAQFDHIHDVALTPGGLLHGVYARDHLRVNSVHYQGVDQLADGLSIEATAPDGLVEAFSANIGGAQVLGVQWHPEWQAESYHDSQKLFQLMGRALHGQALG